MPVNVIPVLAQTRHPAEANAKVLDHISATRLPPSPKPTTPPISKKILTAIFRPTERNHVFIENEQENHFLYGLVLPLVARLLAVSTPGLLVVVQLPRPDIVPEWAIPTYDRHGSNRSGSNGSGSKSAAPTTPSPQDTTRTPSLSDDLPPNTRKSISPEAHPRTEELIRHADNVLSKEAEKLDERDNRSPPPDSVVQDNAALRLICNGFEVLTGKMPPPTFDMGAFTLASVAWEKAGVLEPEDPGKGVSMNFSNGMTTPTEGIAVTFSNGSLCLLTTRDPLSGLDALKISEDTPVVIFSFVAEGYASVAELQAMKPDSLTPVAAKVRQNLKRSNFFFVEIGHSGAIPSTTTGDSPEAQGSGSDGEKNAGKKSNASDVGNDEMTRTCPPILISSVPRAIPLFVNTINQTFIDHPHYDHAENYEPHVANDRSPKRSSSDRSEPADKEEEPPHGSSLDYGKLPTDNAEKKEETYGKEVVAYSSALEAGKSSTVTVPQPTKRLPAVDDVRMSQGIPGGHGHHASMYNYPYPPGPMYNSTPQSHHVLPHHVPAMHQGHSMGNPYYMSAHTNGHTGHPAQYQPRYTQNGYYAQHVVPGHDNWHQLPQYHGLPQHVHDARRDMPAQFAHRVDGRYYPAMQHGEMYRPQHMSVPPGAAPHEINRGGQYPSQIGFPGAPMTSAPVADPQMHRPPEPGPSSTDIPRRVSNEEQGKESINEPVGSCDNENALKALMKMRSRECETGRESSADAQTRGIGKNNVISKEQRMCASRRDGYGRSPVRRSRRTETSSSTSTNSGGGALMKAIVGHSQVKLPSPKRRKR